MGKQFASVYLANKQMPNVKMYFFIIAFNFVFEKGVYSNKNQKILTHKYFSIESSQTDKVNVPVDELVPLSVHMGNFLGTVKMLQPYFCL